MNSGGRTMKPVLLGIGAALVAAAVLVAAVLGLASAMCLGGGAPVLGAGSFVVMIEPSPPHNRRMLPAVAAEGFNGAAQLVSRARAFADQSWSRNSAAAENLADELKVIFFF